MKKVAGRVLSKLAGLTKIGILSSALHLRHDSQPFPLKPGDGVLLEGLAAIPGGDGQLKSRRNPQDSCQQGADMSIKFKCKCGHVISVPEKLAGKSGKCPKCKETVKVPVPKPAKQAVAKQASAAPVASGPMAGMLDSLFDDAGLTQKTGPTCSSCMVAIKPGTVICTNCGMNFETGEKIKGFDLKASGPEFDNMYLQEAADNMVRDTVMESRRDKAAMPWWVIMSFLIGAMTLCAAGVVIVDGKFGTPAAETSFIGKVQRWPVFTTLGLTSLITGVAITVFAHLSITFFGFTRNVWQGVACFFLPLIYSLIYGIMSWTENKAPVKAIMMALVFIGFGVFLIMRAGGFGLITSAF